MLALTRRIGEHIVINDNITVTIVDVKGDNVKIAIDAPKEIKIYRGELYQAIVAENKKAMTAPRLSQLEALKDFSKSDKK